jgi:hypothetical protein
MHPTANFWSLSQPAAYRELHTVYLLSISMFHSIKKGLQTLRGYSIHFTEQKIPVNIWTETNACRDMGNVCVISIADALCGSHCISTHLSAFCRTEVCIPLKIPGFTRISQQAFSTHCCNTFQSLNGAECTKVFRCPHNKKSKGLRLGDREGKLTGLPCPIHCSLKVWFRCCLTLRR